MMRLQGTFVALGAASTLLGIAGTTAAFVFTRSSAVSERVNVLVLVLLLTIGLAAATGYRLAQAFRRRLFEIEEAAVLMAGGRLHHRVARFGEHDEIDQVAAEFNRMGEQLQAQVELLQRLAEENQSLTEQAERAATMEERQRLARELHDSVSQELFALTMLSETAIRRFESGSPKLLDNLKQMADLANRGQREMRALLLHLRPVELEGRSLQEAAESFLRAIEERHELACHFTSDARANFPAPVEEQLFRILQEAVANVLKHAKATELRVDVKEESSSYELIVSDNGVGIGVDAGVEAGAGMEQAAKTQNLPGAGAADNYGMRAMRERSARLGGRLEVFPRNPGTTIKVVIPRADRGEEG